MQSKTDKLLALTQELERLEVNQSQGRGSSGGSGLSGGTGSTQDNSGQHSQLASELHEKQDVLQKWLLEGNSDPIDFSAFNSHGKNSYND